MSSNKQQAVITAAIALFAQHGLAGTTMEAVAGKAKVSKRTLYKYYSSKEHLFDGVVDLLIERIRPLQENHFCAQTPIKEQLQAQAHVGLQLTQDKDYLTLSRIVMIESLRSKKRAAKLQERFQSFEQGLHSWFYEAQQQGALGETPAEIAAAVFHGGMKKLAYWEQLIKWKPPVEKEKLDQLVELTCRMFTRH
ncbi:transcriptional regulator, TetR family [Pseudoalteromonas sp. SW0106-04]|uniref:TetR/AcrR family transcriptional regulator n=1 Tax=Pseudoalteromonas sp. SW0106-04 TaxID=1702169 RepID=UPI0006B5FE50|nr:TetR/AcrR family transcriptional regulator [Pseudoalteromonas sp. SW0106-04]GAP76272.1 transcriptional regulator, TetR family [Pseudoalteromonas sp. SW0106-04]